MTALTEILVLSLALAMDAAAVSAGLAAARAPSRSLMHAAVLFALAQAGMAGIGALTGAWLATTTGWAHWAAFTLLALVGGKMLVAPANDADTEPSVHFAALTALAIATSIDALAAGVGLPMLTLPLVLSLGVIGGTTLLLCFLGARFGALLPFGHRAEQVAGILLIAIGLRIAVVGSTMAP